MGAGKVVVDVIFDRISKVDNFRPEVESDVMSGVAIDPTNHIKLGGKPLSRCLALWRTPTTMTTTPVYDVGRLSLAIPMRVEERFSINCFVPSKEAQAVVNQNELDAFRQRRSLAPECSLIWSSQYNASLCVVVWLEYTKREATNRAEHIMKTDGLN